MTTTPSALDNAPPLPPDTEIGERFRILKAGSRFALGHSYVATPLDGDPEQKVLLRLLPAYTASPYHELTEQLDQAQLCEHRSLSKLLSHGLIDDQPFMTYELVGGQPLEQAIMRKRSSGAAFLPRTALSLITPVCQALAAVHECVPHGFLDPGCILVGHTGQTHLTELGCGLVTHYSLLHGGDPSQSPFVAPEIREYPEAANVASDIFSLGLVVVAMLTNIPLRESNGEALSHFLTDVPPKLGTFLQRTLSDDPNARPPSVRAFIEDLTDGIEDLRDRLIEMTGESPAMVVSRDNPPKGRAQRGFSKAASLSGLLAAADLPPVPTSDDDRAIWLVHRDGFDYGPYTSEQVRERLLQDEIDEHTDIRNTQTRTRGYLTEIPEFADFVADYVPMREERRRKEEVRRAEVQRKVKRAGATGIILILVVILGLFCVYLYWLEYIRPKPKEMPLESAFAVLSSELEPPDRAYVGIEADPELIAALLSPVEPEPPPEPRRRRRRNNDNSTDDIDIDDGDPLDRGTIDFTSNGSTHRLTQADINATIRREARAIHRCFAMERADNPDFARLGRITVQFTVRPDGRPVGVSLTPGLYTDGLRSCIVRVFRSLRYPEHSGLALPVTFPIEIQ